MKHFKINKSKSLSIIYRSNTDKAVTMGEKIVKFFTQKGFSVYTGPDQKEIKGAPLQSLQEYKKSQLIIALGGDGTYLRANRLLEGASVPILGIHLGSLGFLTPIRAEEAISVLNLAIKGQLVMNPRSMIQLEFKRDNKSLFKSYCLNDVVVERGDQSQLIHLSLSLGNSWITNAKADGIVISTPLGSTAYNLAVGGPLLHAQSKSFAVSMIAPHALTTRPLVLPETEAIKISIVNNTPLHICGRLVVDGKILTQVLCKDEVILKKAKQPHWLVRPPSIEDFQILREKLNFGERL